MLKKSLSWLLTIAMILSCVTMVHAEKTGVSGIKWSLANNVYTVTWTNPTDDTFVKNELYKHNGSSFGFVSDLGTETTTTLNAVNGENRYMIKSYFSSGETADVYTGRYKYLSKDTTTFPGFNLDLRNDQSQTGELFGEVGITYDEAYSGERSAYFASEHGYQSNVYNMLYKTSYNLEHGQRYCFSFMAKVPEGTEKYIFNMKVAPEGVTAIQKDISIGSACELKDGQWHHITEYFEVDGFGKSAAIYSVATQLMFTRLGTVYIDDIEIYMVDENNNRYGKDDRFAKAGTFEEKKGITDLKVETAANPDKNPSLSWTNPTDGTVEYNDIYVSIDGGEQIPVTSLSNGETSYEDTGRVTKNAVYTYTIKTTYDDGTVSETSASRAIIRHYSERMYGGWDLTANEPTANVIMPRTNKVFQTMEKASQGAGSLKVHRPHKSYLSNGQSVLGRWATLDSASKYVLTFDYNSTMYSVTLKAGNAALSATNGEWVSYSKEITGTSSVQIGFAFDYGGEFWFDNVKLYKVGEENVNILEKTLGMDCNFEPSGAKNLAYTSPDVNTINLTWENPTGIEIAKNELYIVENGERRLITAFENGETSYSYEGAEAGTRYDFVLVSYIGSITKEASVTAYAKRKTTNNTYLPGWGIDYRDPNPERFRGQIGLDSEIKHSGQSSLFYELEHTYTSMYYATLFRYISEIDNGKTYRVSGWFRSEGYGATPKRIQIMLGHSDQNASQKYDMTECDGEWQYFEFIHTVTTGNEALQILMDSQGKVWFDDLEIYEVEDVAGSWEIIGENLLAGRSGIVGGDFEYELNVQPLYVEGDAETKEVTAEVYVGNSIMMKPESKLIIAIYNELGGLVKVDTILWNDAQKDAGITDVEFVPNEHYVTLTTDGYEDGYEVKVFAWDDMIPLCASISNLE